MYAHLELARFAREIAMHPVMAAATNSANTRKGEEGGFAVPTEVANLIFAPSVGALLPMTSQMPMTIGSSLELPVDLSSAYDESGIISAWEAELDELPEYKPNLKKNRYDLHKLVTLVPVTNELLEDSAALAAYLPVAMQTAVTRRVNSAILNGTGVGTPLGALKSEAVITVAKAGSQAATSVVDDNIKAMLERALNPVASAWIINPATYAKVIGLAAWEGTSRTLAGLPIVATDACPAPGNPGDILLAEMAGYIAALKSPKQNMSSHLWFDRDLSAFRLTFRMDGAPVLAAPITPPNASVSKSHFVALAERT